MIKVQEAPMKDVPRRGDAAVEVRDLRKEFSRRGKKRGERRSRIALDGVTFAMERGETASYVFERLVRSCVRADLRARCKDALDVVHETSAGVPREVSAACSLLLAGLPGPHSTASESGSPSST